GVAIGQQESWIEFLLGEPRSEVIEPDTAAERQVPDGPLVLCVRAEIALTGLRAVVERGLGNLVRDAVVESIAQGIPRVRRRVDKSEHVADAELEGMRPGDVGHRRPVERLAVPD